MRICCAVFIVMVVFSFLSQVRAQTTDPLVDEGVQLTLEQQDIAHLQRSGLLRKMAETTEKITADTLKDQAKDKVKDVVEDHLPGDQVVHPVFMFGTDS